MATYLPIRAFNRSQNVRIDGQKILPTANAYVNIDDAKARKELAYHSAIGAVYPTGMLTDINVPTVVQAGGNVTLGSITGEGASSFVTATVTAVDLHNRDTGAHVTTQASQTQAIILNASGSGVNLTNGQSANVIVYVDSTTGTVGFVAGAAATTGSQVDPTVPTGKVALARCTFTYATTNATGTVTDIRPLQ